MTIGSRFAALLLLSALLFAFSSCTTVAPTPTPVAATQPPTAQPTQGAVDGKPVESSNQEARDHRSKAMASYDKADYDAAIVEFTKAIESDPTYVEAYYGRGFTYHTKGDYARAIEDYTKALELKDDYTEAYLNRGLSYRDSGDKAKAKADLEKALDLAKAQGKDTISSFAESALKKLGEN